MAEKRNNTYTLLKETVPMEDNKLQLLWKQTEVY
jgi:hypothetical protein